VNFPQKKSILAPKNRFFQKNVYFVKESGFVPPSIFSTEEKKNLAEESVLAGNG
jgi:hypothetical protein